MRLPARSRGEDMCTTGDAIAASHRAEPSTASLDARWWIGAGLLAAAVFLNEAVFRVLDAEEFTFDWQVAMRIAVCAACGLYGLLALPRTLPDLCRLPGLWVAGYGAWAAITLPLAVNPRYALGTTFTLGCVVLFIPAVLRQLTGRQVLVVLVVALGAFVAGSWLVYLAMPGRGVTEFLTPDLEVVRRFGGLAHANACGRVTVLWIVLLLAAGEAGVLHWRIVGPALALAVATLVATDSRTSMIAVLPAVVVLGLRRLPGKVVVGVGVAAGLGLALIGLALACGLGHFDLDAILTSSSRSGSGEEFSTLTGRTQIWQFVASRIAASPLIGCGHGCTRFVLAAGFSFPAYHAHNQLLNAFFSCGVVGGVLVAGMFLAQLRGMLVRPDPLADGVFLVVLVGGLADCMIFTPIPDACTLIWLVAFFWRPAGKDLSQNPGRRPSEPMASDGSGMGSKSLEAVPESGPEEEVG